MFPGGQGRADGRHTGADGKARETSWHQADALARISAEQGVTCAVAMNRRHIPVVQKVLQHMRNITTITQVDGVFMKNTDLGHEWDYASAFSTDGIHALDLVRYMAGSEVRNCATVIGRFFRVPHRQCMVEHNAV